MEIFAEIKNILAELLDLEDREITPESYLIRELGAESIDLLEMAVALNARFGIEINEGGIFLKDLRSRPGVKKIPFLTELRRHEIASDLEGGPVLKVKDLVSYVNVKLEEAGRHVVS